VLQPLRPQHFAAAVVILIAATLPAAATPDATTAARVSEAYGKLPLSFEANAGQVDKAVRFLSRGHGYILFLTTNEAVFSLDGPPHDATVVRMRTVGGNRHPRVTGERPLSTQSNYFLGNDPVLVAFRYTELRTGPLRGCLSRSGPGLSGEPATARI